MTVLLASRENVVNKDVPANKAAEVHVVELVLAVLPDNKDTVAKRVMLVKKVHLVSLVNADCLDKLDPQVTKDPRVLRVTPEKTVNPVILVNVENLASKANRVMKVPLVSSVLKVPSEKLVSKVNVVIPVPLERLAKLVYPEMSDFPEEREITVLLDLPGQWALQVFVVSLVIAEKLVLLALQVLKENAVHLVPPEDKVPGVPKDSKEHKVRWEQLVDKDHLEKLDPLVIRVVLVPEVNPVLLVVMD